MMKMLKASHHFGRFQKTGQIISLILCISLLQGCAGGGVKSSSGAIQTNQANQLQNNLKKQLLALSLAYQKAESGNLGFYSPAHYAAGKSALDDAKTLLGEKKSGFSLIRGAESLFSSKTPEQRAAEKIATAQSELKAALAVKKKVQSAMQPQFDEMDYLTKISAPTYFPGAFKDLSEKVNDVIKNYEEGPIESAEKMRLELADEQRKLEIRTMKYQYLKEPKAIVDSVTSEGAGDISPVSLKAAQQSIQAAEQVIEKDPRDMDAIKLASTFALHQAQRAKVLLYGAKDLLAIKSELESGGGEQYLLKFEKNLIAVGQGLGVSDFQYMTFDKQADFLANKAKLVAGDHEQTAELMAKLTDANKALKAAQTSVDQLTQQNQSLKSQIADNEAQITLLQQSAYNLKPQSQPQSKPLPQPDVVLSEPTPKAEKPTAASKPVAVNQPVAVKEVVPVKIKPVPATTAVISKVKAKSVQQDASTQKTSDASKAIEEKVSTESAKKDTTPAKK